MLTVTPFSATLWILYIGIKCILWFLKPVQLFFHWLSNLLIIMKSSYCYRKFKNVSVNHCSFQRKILAHNTINLHRPWFVCKNFRLAWILSPSFVPFTCVFLRLLEKLNALLFAGILHPFHDFSGMSGNSEQKNILQTVELLIHLGYLLF